ncbi:MAG: hypothetical protein ACAH83_10210 [Alphaproteobacteria bacterium]
MKDQSPLTPGEVREAFDKARAKAREEFSGRGTGAILSYLSETVGAMQAEGAAIKLVVRNDSHSNAYDMMYTVSGGSGGTIDAYGFVLCGETSHLFAVASQHEKAAVARMYISRVNVTEAGGRISTDAGKSASRTVISGLCFDFNQDAEALKKMQQHLITLSAGNDAMLECDSANVFNKEPAAVNKMQKPGAKLKL